MRQGATTPQHAKTAFPVPMAEHVAVALKSVGVASTVRGFQMEFTTALTDAEHSIFASWPTSGASRSLEAISAGFSAVLADAGVDDFGRRRGDAETKLFCGASARHSSCVIQEPICWTAHDEIEYGPAAAGAAHSHVQIQTN